MCTSSNRMENNLLLVNMSQTTTSMRPFLLIHIINRINIFAMNNIFLHLHCNLASSRYFLMIVVNPLTRGLNPNVYVLDAYFKADI